MLLWVGCIAGALPDHQYSEKLAKAGFGDIDIEATRVYDIEDRARFWEGKEWMWTPSLHRCRAK